MKITVNAAKRLRRWPRVEEYQNSTLRYAPPPSFAEYCASVIGRPRIMRCWITLDEVWDYRTDEYFWDFRIGESRYEGDPNHYPYDGGVIVPSDTRYIDYLTTHAAQADELIFNIRRYEREVTDGVITLEKYEEVVERVLEYYKNICPKLVYVECCNEVELGSFGGLTMPEYYELYKRTYRAVGRLNAKYGYEKPMKVGGFAMSGCVSRWAMWEDFLRLMAADDSPDKLIDFYSMHDYSRDIFRLSDFYVRHNELVHRLGLPDVPLFINEYGTTGTTGVLTDSLKNASGIIAGLILSSRFENAHVFPWCTFHNPALQISFTQFLRLTDMNGVPTDAYAPTPCGNAVTALHMLKEDELEILEYTGYKAVATADPDGSVALLVTNMGEETAEYELTVNNLKGYSCEVEEYLVDSVNNNCVTGPAADSFAPTGCSRQKLTRGALTLKFALEPHAFKLLKIKAGT